MAHRDPLDRAGDASVTKCSELNRNSDHSLPSSPAPSGRRGAGAPTRPCAAGPRGSLRLGAPSGNCGSTRSGSPPRSAAVPVPCSHRRPARPPGGAAAASRGSCASGPSASHPVWRLASSREGHQRCQLVRQGDVEWAQEHVGRYKNLRLMSLPARRVRLQAHAHAEPLTMQRARTQKSLGLAMAETEAMRWAEALGEVHVAKKTLQADISGWRFGIAIKGRFVPLSRAEFEPDVDSSGKLRGFRWGVGRVWLSRARGGPERAPESAPCRGSTSA